LRPAAKDPRQRTLEGRPVPDGEERHQRQLNGKRD